MPERLRASHTRVVPEAVVAAALDRGDRLRSTAPEESRMTGSDGIAPVELPELPDTDSARRAIDMTFANEKESLANHSVRSYLFAMIQSAHEEQVVSDDDKELIFFASILHDMGTTDAARGEPRFELQGADLAAEFLRAEGFDEDRVDRVWEAIALHTTPQIPERRGPVARLLQSGVVMDFGVGVDAVSDELAEALFARYPRLELTRTFVACLVEQVSDIPAKGPRFTMAGELFRERAARGVTELEEGASLSRWKS
jgi:HD domain